MLLTDEFAVGEDEQGERISIFVILAVTGNIFKQLNMNSLEAITQVKTDVYDQSGRLRTLHGKRVALHNETLELYRTLLFISVLFSFLWAVYFHSSFSKHVQMSNTMTCVCIGSGTANIQVWNVICRGDLQNLSTHSPLLLPCARD